MKLPKRADLQSFFQSDRAILMTCIGIALIFWLLLKLSLPFNSVSECRIEYQLPEGRTFTSTPPMTAQVTIEGRGWDLLSHYFNRDDLSVNLQLARTAQQTINSSLIKDKIQQQLGKIKVMDLGLDYVQIQLDQSSSKTVPIVLNQQIDFLEGYQLRSSILLSPDSVRLSGPSTIIEEFEQWPTSLLEIEALKKDFTEEVELTPPLDPVIQLSPTLISVNIEVEQFTEKSSIFIPLTILNAPDSIKIFPDKIQISCIVGLSRFNEVKANQFELVADLKNIPLNTQNNTIPIRLTKSPPYVSNVQYTPQSVEFFYVKNEVKDTVLVEQSTQ